MKRQLLTIAICLIICTCFASAARALSIDALAGKSMENITAEYTKKYPATGMKKGLCVLPLSEDSPAARERGIGTTMREILSGTVNNSQVFFLVDRDTLANRMKEMQLSMAGITDEAGMVSAGRQTGVSVFLSGSITEIEDQFQITLRLVDTETGAVVSQDSFRVHRGQMVKKQEEIAFAYIAQYGIGINYQTSYLLHPRPMGGVTLLNDIFVSYRPVLWLNLKLGFTHMYLEMWDDAKVNPDQLLSSNPAGNTQLIGYTNGKINQSAPYIGAEYNWMISPSFALAVGLGITMFMPNTLQFEQIYNGCPVRKVPSTETWNGVGNEYNIRNTMTLIQTMDPSAMFRIEIKPQYFISPRATIGLYIAATYTTPLRVDRADFGDGVAIYPHEDDGNTDEADWHYGFSAKQMGLDKNGNVEDDLKLMGCAFGLSVSFYF